MSTLPRCEFDTENLRVKLDISFAADVQAMSEVVDGLMSVVRAMQCACGKEYEVELALREALANAITHGAKGDASRQVQCCVACDESRGMLVVVRDPGAGFDPAKLPSPLMGENVYSEHGRGVYLINQLMDHVEYKQGGTEIHMRAFPKVAAPAKNCGL